MGLAIRAMGQSWYLRDDEQSRRFAQRELRGKQIVNLNTRFDVHMLRAWGADLDAQGCTFHDVAHAEALLNDHLREFSLESIAQRRLGEGKQNLAPGAVLGSLPDHDLAPYAKRDVELVERLHTLQAPLLRGEDLGRVVDLENQVLPAVVEMERNGARVDEDRLRTWHLEAHRCLEQMTFALARKAGFQCNPKRPEDIGRLLKQRGIVNPHRTEKGAESVKGAWLRTIPDDVIQLAAKVLSLRDLISKFLDPYVALVHNGHIYGSFHQLMTGEGGTVSGRFSSAHPNLQAVLKPGSQAKKYGDFTFEMDGATHTRQWAIRDLFVPKEGVWLTADAKQIEYRLFAHYSNAKTVLAAYDEDPEHTNYHMVVMAMVQQFLPSFNDYQQIKNVNFMLIYGGGQAKTAAMLGMDPETATEFFEQYHRALPEVKATARKAIQTAESRGYVFTILGRRGRFINKERSYKALNSIIQGGAADLNKLAIVDVHRHRSILGYTPRLTVHDEMGGDFVGDPAVFKTFLDQQRIPLRVPIRWDVGTGASWAEAKG